MDKTKKIVSRDETAVFFSVDQHWWLIIYNAHFFYFLAFQEVLYIMQNISSQIIILVLAHFIKRPQLKYQIIILHLSDRYPVS